MSKRDREIRRIKLEENLIQLGEARLDREFKERLEKYFAECEVCGCVLIKETAIRGKGEVRKYSDREWRSGSMRVFTQGKDYIYYSYYCKKHKPKPAYIKPAGN